MKIETSEKNQSSLFFNTDRIVRREREKELQNKKLTAIEQVISIDVS